MRVPLISIIESLIFGIGGAIIFWRTRLYIRLHKDNIHHNAHCSHAYSSRHEALVHAYALPKI
jgi:hypothetical protein